MITFEGSKRRVISELKHLTTINKTTRPWHLPLVIAISVSFPVFCGVYFGKLSAGLLASLGAMVILNLPSQGSLLFRMTTILACSFGYVGCFAVGLLTHLIPSLTPISLLFITFWVTIFSRYYCLAPPSGLFIIMATAIALFMPVTLADIPYQAGLMVLGSLFAGVIGCGYTLILLYKKPISPTLQYAYEPDLLADSMLMAGFVALSLSVAMAMHLPRPYWVPMSCYIIMQTMNFRSLWIKQWHRLLGTALGLIVAWALLAMITSPWLVAAAIFGLMLCIENLVVRHYGAAVMFITPLTIMLAEFSNPAAFDHISHATLPLNTMITVRFWDTLLGCMMGVIGGMVMHSPMIRQKLRRLETAFLQNVIKNFSS